MVLLCQINSTLDASEADVLVVRKCQLEKTPKPPCELCDVVAGLLRRDANDLLEHIQNSCQGSTIIRQLSRHTLTLLMALVVFCLLNTSVDYKHKVCERRVVIRTVVFPTLFEQIIQIFPFL